jgi:hypothetical protein
LPATTATRGRHFSRDLDSDTLQNAIGLLYADGAKRAQLSFFGGEPFLAFDVMQTAVALATAEAAMHDAELVLQCTTNGSVLTDTYIAFIREHDMHITVSIDGIQPAHEANRPKAGGGSSFGATHRGLRKLLDAGIAAEAMMVMNWSEQDKKALEKELQDVARAQLARALLDTHGRFEPFEAGMRRQAFERQTTQQGPGPHPSAAHAAQPKGRHAKNQLVVATSGNLYPCAPMVGEDRDEGPEAALRIGHIDEGREVILASLAARGAGCHDGEGCACAAYLETGNRFEGGPLGHWYGIVCARFGAIIEQSLGQKLAEQQAAATPIKETAPSRRALLMTGIGLFAGGVGYAALRMFGGGPGCTRTAGEIAPPMVQGKQAQPPKPLPKPGKQAPPPQPPGGLAAPPPQPAPPAPPPPTSKKLAGRIAPPKRPRIIAKGDVAAPPPPRKPKTPPRKPKTPPRKMRVMVDGEMAPPPRYKPRN